MNCPSALSRSIKCWTANENGGLWTHVTGTDNKIFATLKKKRRTFTRSKLKTRKENKKQKRLNKEKASNTRTSTFKAVKSLSSCSDCPGLYFTTAITRIYVRDFKKNIMFKIFDSRQKGNTPTRTRTRTAH